MTGRKMTSEELIAGLTEAPLPRPFAPAVMAATVLLATALGTIAWTVAMGLRPDLGPALGAPVTLAKTLLPALLAVCSLWLAARSAYPGERLRPGYLLVPASVAIVLVAGSAIQTPPPLFLETMAGSTALKCVTAILGLSLLPMAAGLAFLMRGASTRPALTGTLLGLAAGAGAATGYSLACTEDAPLFYVVWYGVAILGAGCIGALVSSRLLRW